MPYIRQFGGVSGITNQPQGLDLGLAGTNIKSIQMGQVTTTLSTQSVTITAVNRANSIILCNSPSSGTDPSVEKFAPTFVSDTSFNLVRGTAGSSRTINYAVIEFNNVKSIQRGISATSVGLAQVTVSPVNPLKSILLNNFIYLASVTNISLFNDNYRIVNSTTIELNDYSNGNSRNYWQLIEFN